MNVFNSNKVGIIQLSNLIIKTGDFEPSKREMTAAGVANCPDCQTYEL